VVIEPIAVSGGRLPPSGPLLLMALSSRLDRYYRELKAQAVIVIGRDSVCAMRLLKCHSS
jgi:hypothetical protein